MFVLGYAYQAGYLPLSADSIRHAIELNGEAVAMNLAAFDWGRAAYVDPATIEISRPRETQPREQSLEEILTRRVAFLTSYQNAAYAARYRALVARVAEAEAKSAPRSDDLAKAVARNLFKLMAYKDEYEVARLYTDGSFQRQVAQAFEGDLRFEFHLAPPLLARKDAVTGEAKKMSFGPWMMKAFGALAAMRFLRGTMFDIFGFSPERREERALISEYEALCGELIAGLTPANHEIALALAALPEKIRGYGHVKARHLAKVRPERERLLDLWRNPPAQMRAAE
jgi:indolepyruvate ferredoxin oxidoreductase